MYTRESSKLSLVKKDVVYLWRTAQVDRWNGLRVINDVDLYDVLLSDRDSDKLISTLGRGTEGAILVRLGSSLEEIRMINHLLCLVDVEEFALSNDICPFFNCNELGIVAYSSATRTRLCNCIRKDGLHYFNPEIPISLEDIEAFENLWSSATSIKGLFVGNDNPDECRVCYRIKNHEGVLIECVEEGLLEDNRVRLTGYHGSFSTLNDVLSSILPKIRETEGKGGAFIALEGGYAEEQHKGKPNQSDKMKL